MKKFVCYVLCALLTITMSAFAQNADEQQEVIEYSYPIIHNCVLEGRPTCVATKVTFDGRDVIKVVPTPHTGTNDTPRLDSWSLAANSMRTDITKYPFVSISYYLSEDADIDTKMSLSFLPGSTKALKSTVTAESSQKLEKGKWSVAYFKFSEKVHLNPDAKENHITQMHFAPYGNLKTVELSENDIIYIEKISFHKTNPDPNANVKVSFMRGKPNALGKQISIIADACSSVTLPDCPYTLNGGVFAGWSDSDGKIYNAGDKLSLEYRDINLVATWDIIDSQEKFKVLNFAQYQNGIVDGKDTTVSYSAGDYNGVNAMKAVINKNAEKGTLLALDGWNYATANVDLESYKWMAILYRYDSVRPVSPSMRIGIMKSNILSSAYMCDSLLPIVCGKWDFALFDLSGSSKNFLPDMQQHIIRQIHIYPFGNTSVKSLEENDSITIASVLFFKDKPESLQFYESYMNGYENGSFKPDGTISRAEAVAITARVCDKQPTTIKKPHYIDLNENAWYYDSVCKLYSMGAVSCFGGDNFDPSKPITRAEFADIVFKCGLSTITDGKVISFKDVNNSHAMYDAVCAASSAGLIVGYNDGTFRPDNSIKRSEALIVVNRAIGRYKLGFKHDFYCIYTDVDITHYAFDEICAATVPYATLDNTFLGDFRIPLSTLTSKIEPDFSQGNKLLSEIESKTNKRIDEIRNTPDDHSSITGKTYYVSPNGNDNNDGLSPQTPWQTIAKVNRTALEFGDGVLFERGGVYRDEIKAKSGITYAAYGSGAKPIICGSPENGAVAEKWTLFYENDGVKIWQYDRTDFKDIGSITMNDGEIYAKKEVPSFQNGRFYVRNTQIPFDVKLHLPYDLCFFHKADSVLTSNVPNPDVAVGELYLRCDKGNPGEVFDVIEFGSRRRGINIERTTGVTVDNLHIKYCGCAGIGGTGPVFNLKVQNCEASFLGGTIQTYKFKGNPEGKVTRAGNGIETYGTTDGFIVDNCYVHQVYDAGLSHQVASGGTHDVDMSNISYINNVIEDCVYGIEYFNGAADIEETIRTGRNILMEGNIIRRSGYGFGSTRPDGNCQAAIKSWNHRNEFENFFIRNNIFDRSVWNLLHISADYPEWMPVMNGNTYVQTYNVGLASYRNKRLNTLIDIAFKVERDFGDSNATSAYVSVGVNDYPHSKENLSRFDVFGK